MRLGGGRFIETGGTLELEEDSSGVMIGYPGPLDWGFEAEARAARLKIGRRIIMMSCRR